MEEGRAVASFPEKNAKNYSNNADHFMLIARPSGRDLNLRNTFRDIDPTDYMRGYYLQYFPDDAEKTRFMSYGP